MSHNGWMRILLLTLLLLAGTINIYSTEFESPSKYQITQVTLNQIKYNLRGKNIGLEYRELFDKAIAAEQIGFMGYHGDSLEFLVYQDIIRILVEEILGIPIRKDFHFVSIPWREKNSLQSLEELSQVFVKDVYNSQMVAENTFPLNFTIYANHNRLGLNSVLNFSKNVSDMAIKARKELIQLFEQELGMDSQLLETLYNVSRQHLDSQTGVLLQFFDSSSSPYAFGNAVGYASYPNGFIAGIRLISEYFLDKGSDEFPHELRLVLNICGVLNPASPIIIKRYTKIQPSKLKAWEQDLRILLRTATVDPIKRDEWRQALLQAWHH